MLELEIKKMGINGEGIAYYNRKIVFVDNALPKEKVKVEIVEETDRFVKADLKEIIVKSPFRCIPKCEKFDECGGCNLQHLKYEEQLNIKRELVIEALEKYSGLNPRKFEIKKTIGMSNPYNYRNKVSAPVKDLNGCAWGMYKPNTNHLVILHDCLVQYNDLNDCLNKIVKLMDKLGFKPKSKNEGLIKYIVCRQSNYTKEIQVTLILGETKTDVTPLVDEIKNINNVVSIYTDINKGESPDIFGDKLKKHFGKDFITDKLDKYYFNLLPNAFFQLNSMQAVTLYNEAKKAAKLSLKEKVVDCYCGVGTISIWVSNLAKEVIGIENNKEAIKSAKENALNNKVKNVNFICGDAANELDKIDNIDCIIADPPRSGMRDLAYKILDKEPKRLVYVSCNPSTLAKDIKILSKKYDVKYIQPIDMFPQTSNVEAVVSMVLKNK
ncbi:MAG: 23S rRNA (uracil(1939)-C(5))-methyltransferase RlmD [Acholeplasmatales bacterium]|nr:23S rRNA (uracil(1939)-C(5))-methyltransferase RlmD [Acholeplasmatales bacterium]